MVILLAGVGSAQLLLNAFNYKLPDYVMMWTWGIGGVAVAAATFYIERYKLRRERWSRP